MSQSAESDFGVLCCTICSAELRKTL